MSTLKPPTTVNQLSQKMLGELDIPQANKEQVEARISTLQPPTTVNQLSQKMLRELDISQANEKQVETMQSILADTGLLFFTPAFSELLDLAETIYLYWVVKGKTHAQIAKLMNVTSKIIGNYKKQICRKLNCNTIAQAVYEGFQFVA